MEKSRKLGVIDYGTGNLKSVVKAFEYLKTEVRIYQSPEGLDEMDAIIFPGQGSFDQCMESLVSSGLGTFLKSWIMDERPYFGICLGLQVLFEMSEEGNHPGLGLYSGRVKRFRLDSSLKIPHMGWNSVTWNVDASHWLRSNLQNEDQFYFVHSYYLSEPSRDLTCFETTYGKPFVSGVLGQNCLATQFHPEKSQAKGLQLYRNFLEKFV